MKVFRKRTTILVASVLAVGLFSVPAFAGDDSLAATAKADCPDGVRDVRVAGIGLYSDAVLTLGSELGFFKKHCVNVVLQTVPSTPSSVAAVIGGSVDIGWTTVVPFIRAVSEGLPLKVVSPDVAFTPDANKFKPMEVTDVGVYMAENSSMTRARDLEGKTVAIPALGAQGQVQVAADVKTDGGDLSTIKWVALGFATALSQLNAGQVDAATLAYPITAQAEKTGNKLLFASGFALFPPGVATAVWVTSAATYKEKTELLADFNAAYAEAQKYVMAHPDEFRKEVAAYTNVPLNIVKEQNLQYYFPEKIIPAQLTTIAQKMKDLGALESAPDMSNSVADFTK